MDYLGILKLSHGFTQKELKSAYYRAAKRYHPDINKSPDAEKNFKIVQAAYDSLRISPKLYQNSATKVYVKRKYYEVLSHEIYEHSINLPLEASTGDCVLFVIIGLNEYRISIPKTDSKRLTCKLKGHTINLTFYE